MQRLQAVLITMACVTMGTACVTLAPGADQVRMTQNPGDVVNCKPVGNIRVPTNSGAEIVNNESNIRNQVVGLGGNVAFMTSQGLSESTGIAYKCP